MADYGPAQNTKFTDIRDFTPSDTIALRSNVSGVRVATAGTLVVRGPSNTADVTITAADKEYIPIGGGSLIKAASTATGIVSFGS